MTRNPKPEIISAADLPRLVEEARAENWSELVLLGPGFYLKHYELIYLEYDELKSAKRAFHLLEAVEDLSSRLASLTNLTSLYLGGNRIGDGGAQALAALTNLTSLHLRNNGIGAGGAQALAALTDLTSLDLSNNGIGAGGAQALAALTNLTRLDLRNNGIGAGGAQALAALTNLTRLDLRNNGIGAGGAQALAALTNLTRLDLGGNGIGAGGAQALAALTNLTSLELRDNGIGDGGAQALAAFTNLTSLELRDNGIGAGGAQALAALTNLTSLDLRNNGIGAGGAQALAALTNLTSLHLRNNGIGDGGAQALAALTNLTRLDLRGNRIGAGGAQALAALTNLTSLELRDNRIGDGGAQALAALTDLTWLHLSNNGIGDGGAQALAALTDLIWLDLSNNGIGAGGAQALAALTNLSWLELRDNGIGAGGAQALAGLTNLTSLDLQGNQVGPVGAEAILEAWLQRSDRSRFRHLDLNDNGDLSALLPEEVFANTDDPESILAAYRRFKSGKTQALNEAKLLVVGNEAVGKTSLLRYLIEGEPRDPAEKKTPGIATHEKIETKTWSAGVGDVRLNVWDFGGQEMMRGTHRFFLTARSLYLLVLEDRREDDLSIHEWLKTIKNRAADAPILVVINKSDEGKPPGLRLDEASLRSDYPQIVGFLRTSCDSNDFSKATIQALREKIVEIVAKDERLKHVRDSFPESWLRIKNEVTSLAAERAVLPLSDFQMLCESADQITDEDERRSLLHLLNDLGTIVAHGIAPEARAAHREITLLDPNWLTTAIYRILTSSDCADLQGEFSKGHLAGWLDPTDYPPERHEFILDMMQDEDVGLCFSLGNTDEQRYLVPEALPPSAPFYGNWPADCLLFRYRYDFLPRSLVPRFIVLAHDLLADPPTRWRTGAVFTVEGCPILIETNVERREIDISVDGLKSRRRSALGIITNRLDSVHKRNPECGAKARVPLPDQPTSDVSYDHLLKLEAKYGAGHEFDPEGAERSYTVAELLDGVRQESAEPGEDPPGKRTPKEAATEHQTKEVFVSYTRRNEESVEIVDRLEEAFADKEIVLVRDRSELSYRDSIRDFMTRIGKGKCVVVILSEDYLKSENCMFELTEIADRGDISDRVFPIVLSDAQLSRPVKRIGYVRHWEKEKKELNEEMNSVGNEYLEGIRETIELYTEIRNTIAKLMDILGDMNALTVEDHRETDFAAFFEALERRLSR